MSIFYVIENRQSDEDQNELPDRRTMASAPQYWNWVAQILGASLGGHHEAENERVLALRRNAEHFDAQRRPSVISEIVAEAVDVLVSLPVVRPIKQAVLKTTSAMDRAKAWLLEQLASGPKAAVPLAAAAKEAGIAGRTLERARKALGLKPKRVKGRVWWSLQDGESAKD